VSGDVSTRSGVTNITALSDVWGRGDTQLLFCVSHAFLFFTCHYLLLGGRREETHSETSRGAERLGGCRWERFMLFRHYRMCMKPRDSPPSDAPLARSWQDLQEATCSHLPRSFEVKGVYRRRWSSLGELLHIRPEKPGNVPRCTDRVVPTGRSFVPTVVKRGSLPEH